MTKLAADTVTIVKEQVAAINAAHNHGTVDHEAIDAACDKLLELTAEKPAKPGETSVATDAPPPVNPALPPASPTP